MVSAEDKAYFCRKTWNQWSMHTPDMAAVISVTTATKHATKTTFQNDLSFMSEAELALSLVMSCLTIYVWRRLSVKTHNKAYKHHYINYGLSSSPVVVPEFDMAIRF